MGLDNPLHIAFLLVILLLVFGAKRLPELGRSLGTGMRGFKDSISGESSPTEHVDEVATTPVAHPPVAPVLATPTPVAPVSEPAVEHPPVRPAA